MYWIKYAVFSNAENYSHSSSGKMFARVTSTNLRNIYNSEKRGVKINYTEILWVFALLGALSLTALLPFCKEETVHTV